MVFDGAYNALGNIIGVVIISPEGSHTPFTARLCFDCTNNMAKYEACILGLKAAIDLRIKCLSVYGDSASLVHFDIAEGSNIVDHNIFLSDNDDDIVLDDAF